MEVKVIDISKHNGTIDFGKVKKDGIYGVIIRAGYGKSITQKDPKFEEYYRGAKLAGLKVGAYWYSYTKTVEDAVLEAKSFCSVIQGKQFELPLYFDIEEASQVALNKDICDNIVNAFCLYMESQKYYAGVYSFDTFFKTNLSSDIQKRFTCWVARVSNSKPSSCTIYDMHQYTWKGEIDGVYGDCDVSTLYKDFEETIKNKRLNGYANQIAPKFNVTARMANLSKENATKIAEECHKLGMSVVTSEE